MIIDDGVYQVAFNVPDNVAGFTIKSASGNPYACVLDGQGGVDNGHRLAQGKGIIRVTSPGTIQGIGFINGGGGSSDGEAGVYAELFATEGTLNIINCAFDGNENGIFSPSALSSSSPGYNINIVLNGCVFGYKVGNGGNDGGSHNFYINCKSLTSYNCTHLPTRNGNNVKSRALTINIFDLYNKHGPGRCFDIPSAGKLTIRGGIYTSSGSNAASNFMAYANENQDNGVFPPVLDSMSVYGARANDAIWNGACNAGINMTFTNLKQYWVDPGAYLNLRFGQSDPNKVCVTGIAASPSPPYVSNPDPIFPSWFKN